MTNNQEIEKKVYRIITKVFNKEPSQFSKDTQLISDLLAKSMNFLELQALLEAEFGVDLETQTVMKAKTIGELINLVVSAA